MQELSDSIKRPNLRIKDIEEGKEVQAKGTHNIFNKIITENFPNLEKVLFIQVQEASGHQTHLNIIEPPNGILSLKKPSKAQRTEKEF
jgi:hypothetical protein